MMEDLDLMEDLELQIQELEQKLRDSKMLHAQAQDAYRVMTEDRDLQIQELEKKLQDSKNLHAQAQERITQLVNLAERKMLLVEKCIMVLRGAARYHGYTTVELYIQAMNRRGGGSTSESVAKRQSLRVETLLDQALEALEKQRSEWAMKLASEPLEALFQDAVTQTTPAFKTYEHVEVQTGPVEFDEDRTHYKTANGKNMLKMKWRRTSVFGGPHASRASIRGVICDHDEQALPRLDDDDFGSDVVPLDSNGSGAHTRLEGMRPNASRASVHLRCSTRAGGKLQSDLCLKKVNSSFFGSLRHGISSMIKAKQQVPRSPPPEAGSDDENSDDGDADSVLPVSPRRASLLSLTGAMSKRRSSLDSLASNADVPIEELLRHQISLKKEEQQQPQPQLQPPRPSIRDRKASARAPPAEKDRQGSMPVLLRGRPRPKLPGICA